ncbi:hypothetical protein [Pseudomonas fulva]|nr:hypothetical protein [Pseudomonas fulva]MBF8780367.1 hypothetical protein [Pseudomonas fulva]
MSEEELMEEPGKTPQPSASDSEADEPEVLPDDPDVEGLTQDPGAPA